MTAPLKKKQARARIERPVPYKAGEDRVDAEADYKGFTIDCPHNGGSENCGPDPTKYHYAKIIVFGDEILRNQILEFLQNEPRSK